MPQGKELKISLNGFGGKIRRAWVELTFHQDSLPWYSHSVTFLAFKCPSIRAEVASVSQRAAVTREKQRLQRRRDKNRQIGSMRKRLKEAEIICWGLDWTLVCKILFLIGGDRLWGELAASRDVILSNRYEKVRVHPQVLTIFPPTHHDNLSYIMTIWSYHQSQRDLLVCSRVTLVCQRYRRREGKLSLFVIVLNWLARRKLCCIHWLLPCRLFSCPYEEEAKTLNAQSYANKVWFLSIIHKAVL